MSSYFEHWRLAVKGNLRPERGSGAGFLLLLPYRGATSKGGVRPGTCPRPRHGRGSGRGDGLAELFHRHPVDAHGVAGVTAGM